MVFLAILLSFLLTQTALVRGDAVSTTTGGSWTKGFAKAQALVKQITIAEKVNVTTGQAGNCVGQTGQVPRLKLTALCLEDGPLGVRPVRRVSQFPAGVTTAATWNRDLIAARGTALGQEFHDKGVNIWLGNCPVYCYPFSPLTLFLSGSVTGGPLGRSPFGGRNWEGFGSDPYLHGVASYLTVQAAQAEGVVTCSKHYVAYEQETFRDAFTIFSSASQLPISSNLDDKTAHEVYLWPFAEAVRAGSGANMCSYNEMNGTHACADDHTLNQVLKQELGFQGAIISDWGGTWNTEASALAGMDVTTPGSGFSGIFGNSFGDELVALVENGTVPEARLDDMVLRVLTPILQHQDLRTDPQPTFNANDPTAPTNNVRRDHYKVIQAIGQEAITLVKNNRKTGGGLPLPPPASMSSLAVIGEDASASPYGATSCGDGGSSCLIENNGTMTSGGGSGWAYPPYTIDPLAAINAFVRADGPDINQHLENWDLGAAAMQASRSEAALVFISAYAAEGEDRLNLTAYSQGDALVNAIAAVNKNTIVILHIPGPIIVESWVDHPDVTAVLVAHLPGQESGNSLVPILWGRASPSGKLPYTFAKQESDWPPNTIVSTPVFAPQADFTEKLLFDYKWFDAKNITPRWEFGFGLSYTDFTFGELSLAKTFKVDNTSIQPTSEPFLMSTSNPGSSMYDVLYTASITVKNTGLSEGEPSNSLRGFDKLDLAPGKSGVATFELTRKDLSVWDVQNQRWEIPQGTFKLSAGASSRDFRSVISHSFA